MDYHYSLIIVDPYRVDSEEIETEFPDLDSIQFYLENRYKIEHETNGWINGIDAAMSCREVYAFCLGCLAIVIHREDNDEDDADRYDKEMLAKYRTMDPRFELIKLRKKL